MTYKTDSMHKAFSFYFSPVQFTEHNTKPLTADLILHLLVGLHARTKYDSTASRLKRFVPVRAVAEFQIKPIKPADKSK